VLGPFLQNSLRYSIERVRQRRKESILAGDRYSYKKHQRELAQKKKREEKLQKKLAKEEFPVGAGLEQALGSEDSLNGGTK